MKGEVGHLLAQRQGAHVWVDGEAQLCHMLDDKYIVGFRFLPGHGKDQPVVYVGHDSHNPLPEWCHCCFHTLECAQSQEYSSVRSFEVIQSSCQM